MTEVVDHYEVLDVNDWVKLEDELSGRVRKLWISPDKDEPRWLMKWVTISRPKNQPSYVKGDDWAERIACAVAGVLGVSSAWVELALRKVVNEPEQPPEGIVCKSFLSEEETLVHGVDVLRIARERHPDVDEAYTPKAVMDALRGVPGPEGLSAQAAFAGYLLLDSILGGTDRHWENWGVVKDDDSGEWRLAPTYDHSSCLGFLLSDAQRTERLETRDGGRTPEAFAARAKSPFMGKPNVREVAEEAMRLLSQEERELWQERLLAVDAEALLHCVRSVPDSRMSEPARHFAERVLLCNFQAMSHILRIMKV